MNLETYRRRMVQFISYPHAGTGSSKALSYVALGLAGEAGEVANDVKKIMRDDKDDPTLRRDRIIDELGDVLWYWMAMCYELRVDPTTVCLRNLRKLATRHSIEVDMSDDLGEISSE